MGSKCFGFGALLGVVIAGLPSCSPTGGADDQGNASQPGGSSGGSPPVGAGGLVGVSPDPTQPPVDFDPTTRPPNDKYGDAGCERTASRPEHIVIEIPVERQVEKPIDLYIMADATLSTACTLVDPFSAPPVPTRWTALRDALRGFVNSPNAAGISVALQYYPLRNASCDANVYAQPAVPMGLLPDNAAAITQSLNRTVPEGTTPLNAALRGAVQYARQHAIQNPDRTVAIVFTTDALGVFPCNGLNALAETNAAAADGFNGSPSIRTYVIGQVPGPGEPACGWDLGGLPDANNIHAMAAAGGTERAILVGTGADAGEQFRQALEKIRESVTITETRTEIEVRPVPCEWGIPEPPDGETFDKTKVNFEFAAGAGVPNVIGNVESAADCARFQGGWYYDNPNEPAKIHVCEQTCGVIQGTSDARVDIIFGCETEPAKEPH